MAAGDFSAEELTKSCLGRIAEREDAVGAESLVAFAAELFAPEQLSAVFFGDLGKKRTRRVKAILDGWTR